MYGLLSPSHLTFPKFNNTNVDLSRYISGPKKTTKENIKFAKRKHYDFISNMYRDLIMLSSHELVGSGVFAEKIL